ncbi:MAG: formylglycine-generating enzyme family protein, partial [bacterium]
MISLCGRAQLVRMLKEESKDAFLSALVGYEPVPEAKKEREKPAPEAQEMAQPESMETAAIQQGPSLNFLPVPFFRAERFIPFTEEDTIPEPPADQQSFTLKDFQNRRLSPEKVKMPEPPPLAPWPHLQRRVADLLQQKSASQHLDIDRLLRDISRGRLPRTLPFRTRKRWPRQLYAVVDRSRRMTPFWHDQDVVMKRLSQHLGPKNILEFRMYDGMVEPMPMGLARRMQLSLCGENPPMVLVLGDCGSLSGYPPLVALWQMLGRQLRAKGGQAKALLPAPPGRWADGLGAFWQIAPWEHKRTKSVRLDPAEIDKRALRLLTLIAAASRVEPGLLRTIRRLLPASLADAGTEADVWCHPDVASGSSVALSLEPDAQRKLKSNFDLLNFELDDCDRKDREHLVEKVLQAQRRWREAQPKEIWYEELLNLTEEDQERFFGKECREAQKDFLKFTTTVMEPGKDFDSRLVAQFHGYIRRMKARTGANRALWNPRTPLGANLHKTEVLVHKHDSETRTAAGFDPRFSGTAGYRRQWHIQQIGDKIECLEPGQKMIGKFNGSPIAVLRATRPDLHVLEDVHEADSDRNLLRIAVGYDPRSGKLSYEALRTPEWAERVGQDRFGIWAQFSIGEVTQRMRWIAPGAFMMGSPQNEVGRWDDEMQHRVILTQGYWLFDTPVTQALWTAVMSDNPSHFNAASHPVEQVGWNDCQDFFDKINSMQPGLDLRFPTEAEWEYACRAGTMTATYHGDLNKADEKTGVLDEIAWYDGNSGNKTHAVAQKRPNDWGLYDMLGNVYEWCADWWQNNYPKGEVIDPKGPASGADRVCRGGGWYYLARYVRAAYRYDWTPDYRDYYLGFRCARGQEGAGRGGGQADAPADESLTRRPAVRLQAAGSRRMLIEPEQRVQMILPGENNWCLQSDQGTLMLGRITQPKWAQRIGRDRFGLWCDLLLNGVEQRLRWIPPGLFQMGSPKDEAGRDNDEKQHLVTLTKGFWLFDTLVTQALWTAVMPDNPS